jgi:hypothetical protein
MKSMKMQARFGRRGVGNIEQAVERTFLDAFLIDDEGAVENESGKEDVSPPEVLRTKWAADRVGPNGD